MSPRPDREAGFATPAATMISLALAVMATAVAGRGIAELTAARLALSKLQEEQALGGAEEAAVFTVLQARGQDRLRWSSETSAGPAAVLAEPEGPKLAIAMAGKLETSQLSALGVERPNRVREQLAALGTAAEVNPDQIRALDHSRLWRACGPSLVSALGVGQVPSLAPALAPAPAGVSARGGEVWRVAVSTRSWTEERLVRFTGELERPAAILWRSFRRTGAADVGEDDRCGNALKRG